MDAPDIVVSELGNYVMWGIPANRYKAVRVYFGALLATKLARLNFPDPNGIFHHRHSVYCSQAGYVVVDSKSKFVMSYSHGDNPSSLDEVDLIFTDMSENSMNFDTFYKTYFL